MIVPLVATLVLGLNPPAYQGVGINAFTPAIADQAEALGARLVRVEIDSTGDAQDSIDWPTYDALIDQAHAHGFEVLVELHYGLLRNTTGADWNAPLDDTETNPFIHRFIARAHDVVAHLAPRGVHAWEIWNEPNAAPPAGGYAACPDAPGWGQPWGVCPRHLGGLVTNTYLVIKDVDPQATVVLGGLLWHGEQGSAATAYLDALYDAPAVTWFRQNRQPGPPWDVLGFHPYNAVPGAPGASPLVDALATMDAVARGHGDGGRTQWLTEYGWQTPADCAGHDFCVDEQTQAQLVGDAIDRLREVPYAGALLWFSQIDVPQAGLWFGLLRADGSRKPAFAVWQDRAGRPLRAGRVLASPAPIALPPGGTTTIHFDVINTGQLPFTDATTLGTSQPSDRASSLYDANTWQSPDRPVRVGALEPGQRKTVSFTVRGNVAGSFAESFELVEEYVTWLDESQVTWSGLVR